MAKRILITGNRGYIGSVMAPYFRRKGYEVVGLDTCYYDEEGTFISDPYEIPTIRKDLRDITVSDVDSFDAVIHLAAICNDPLGNLNADWTHEINHQATVRLATLAKETGAKRFLLSSSCSMHGTSTEAKVTEETPVDPITPYGVSKIRAERDISKLADDDFSPTFLRNGTVYGVSPRHRLDIVLNNLVGWAATTGCVRLMTDGSPWRPVVHVEDVCQAFQVALEAPQEKIHNQVFHVGHNSQNYQIRTLAEEVQKGIPGCHLEFAEAEDADKRTYIADFSKIESVLPAFQPKWSVIDGVQELYQAYKNKGLTKEDMSGSRFIRLNKIALLLEQKRLNNTLRWEGR